MPEQICRCPDGAATCDPPSPQAITVSDVSRSTGSLPNTGTNTIGQLQIALLLLLLGASLAVVGRRRRGHRTA